MEVEKCSKKLKTFGTGERSNEEDEAVMSAEKIFPNLEFLNTRFDEAQKWLLSNTVKHPMHRLKELRLSEVNDGERLCQILYRMPNLEKLYLREAEHLLKESSESRLGTVLQLKELDLTRSEIKDIRFEREPGGARAAKLQNIVTANEEGKEEAKWQWEGDLNATIQNVWEDQLLQSASTASSLSLGDSPLQVIWLDSRRIPKSCFSKLKSLTVDGCQFLTDVVIPFYLLPLLTNLEHLVVSDCRSVKSIFDIPQEREITTMGLGAAAFPRPLPFSLKNLTLKRLPKLENVWNEDPHGILTMQLLQHVIVAEDNADPREANLELTFPCPCVRSLKLQGLPKFNYGSLQIGDSRLTSKIAQYKRYGLGFTHCISPHTSASLT
ncbi:hypothetical protein JHK85_018176 [Glycine max]|nr:hypothetical protein JHK85_018176 [Glycine max]